MRYEDLPMGAVFVPAQGAPTAPSPVVREEPYIKLIPILPSSSRFAGLASGHVWSADNPFWIDMECVVLINNVGKLLMEVRGGAKG